MYKIFYSAQAIKNYSKLTEDMRKQVDKKMLAIAKVPFEKNNNIKPLQGRKHCYRLRIGDWRIIYELIQNELKIIIITIGHRKEVYKT
jgi:mRNA interferase RelE/StbE